VPCRHGVPVAGKGDLVLSRARNVPLRPRDLHVLAHRETGRGLPEGCRVRPAEPLHAPGDPGVDPSPRDGVRDDRRGAEAGDAVGGDGLCLDPGRQARLQHDFPGEVRLARFRDHHAERYRANARRIDLMSLQQPADRVFPQCERPERRKGLAGLDERRAGTGDDSHPLICHDSSSNPAGRRRARVSTPVTGRQPRSVGHIQRGNSCLEALLLPRISAALLAGRR
jgi:hypothetical protein